DPHCADRHGREHPDSRLRCHRDRRHRLDPWCVPRRCFRRPDRHARPCLPAQSAAASAERRRRVDRSTRDILDAHLPPDGDRAGAAAGGAVSGQQAMKVYATVPNIVAALVVAGLLLLPLYSQLSGNIFILTLFTRVVILALAAASLNLIMGYG